MTAPAIVDSHHHVWDLSRHAQPFLDSDAALAPLRRTFSIEDLRPLARAANVQATVVVQTLADPAETPELLELAAAESLVSAVVGWTELSAGDVADVLAGLKAMPGGEYLTAIRHPLLTEPDPQWLYRPDVQRGLAAVAAAGMCFDIVAKPGQLSSLVGAVASMPGVSFVLDHLGTVAVGIEVDEAWAAAVTALAELPNTVCKLSGILGEPMPPGGPRADSEPRQPVAHLRPYFDIVLDSFGADRLMFGSDWPVSSLSAPYSTVVSVAESLIADLTETEREAILASTARRVYRING